MQATTRRALHSSFIILTFVLLVSAVAAPAFAAPTASHPAIYGARAMGMGGAYTAVTDDANALYWNPAAVGLSNVSVNAAVGFWGVNNVEAIKALIDDAAKLAELDGRHGLRATVFAGATVGPVGLVTGIDGEGALQPGEGLALEAEANVQKSTGLAFARDVITWGDGLFGVRAGVTARMIDAERNTVVKDVGGNTEESRQTGSGYAVDLGVHVRVTDVFTAGGFVRNAIGHTTWKPTGEKESPSTEYRLGVAVRPPLLGLTVAADVAVPGELRYGVEKTLFFGGLRLRAGQIHKQEGTWTTAGAGLALGPVAVDAAIITPDFKDNSYSIEASFSF